MLRQNAGGFFGDPGTGEVTGQKRTEREQHLWQRWWHLLPANRQGMNKQGSAPGQQRLAPLPAIPALDDGRTLTTRKHPSFPTKP
jgi:hypothetical protein